MPSPRTPRKLALVGTRLAWAAALIAVPGRVISATGGTPDERSRKVARILGARHAIQGAVEAVSWPRWHTTGSAVDALHALTAAGLAALDPARRRVAVADTAVASTFAILGREAATR